jgi:hypothetical protein
VRPFQNSVSFGTAAGKPEYARKGLPRERVLTMDGVFQPRKGLEGREAATAYHAVAGAKRSPAKPGPAV